MAADENALGELHSAVANVLTKALEGTTLPGAVDPESGEKLEEDIFHPPSAAHITAAIQFLKNNNITARPDSDDLTKLNQAVQDAAERRAAARAARITPVTKADLDTADEAAAFRQGLN